MATSSGWGRKNGRCWVSLASQTLNLLPSLFHAALDSWQQGETGKLDDDYYDDDDDDDDDYDDYDYDYEHDYYDDDYLYLDLGFCRTRSSRSRGRKLQCLSTSFCEIMNASGP